MNGTEKESLFKKLKNLIIGEARNPLDTSIFKHISLIAFFAWVGLGADGLSSSCYGPAEAFLSLNGHMYLSIFVAIATVATIFIISASYSQIIELFPAGGGGYLVASKLLSPGLGMVSGCALIIDYVLTISVSIASGSDAIFSILPKGFQTFKLEFSIIILIILIVLNLRGMKESVIALVPIFLIFVITHVFAILYSGITHGMNFSAIFADTKVDVIKAHSEIGLLGILFVLLKAYSMGAGTYTGIEAVSNGLPSLREPKVNTAKRTMKYMTYSLAFIVIGLMLSYLFYNVQPHAGKTLNAVLFEAITAKWGHFSKLFVLITLISEGALLFVAAQAGFLDGPRVIASMALDRWLPTRFTMLSDRLVNKNGIIIIGLSALALLIFAHGSVSFLIVLYSINVFITFSLSQLGMVRYWLKPDSRTGKWQKKLAINFIGLILTSFILVSMIVVKFFEGGWLTLFVTGTLILVAFLIKQHYINTQKMLKRLSSLIIAVDASSSKSVESNSIDFNSSAKTAVLFVNGFNGLGLHTLFGVVRLFEGVYKNFIFVQVGIVDSGNFKGVNELERFENQVKNDISKYVNYMAKRGYYAEGVYKIGTDVIGEIDKLTPELLERFPNATFFGGQLVFPTDSYLTRFLHNYTVFAMQRYFYSKGMLFVLLPIRV